VVITDCVLAAKLLLIDPLQVLPAGFRCSYNETGEMVIL